MRNLKRALSLVMASVMLLGMMVVGTSAASFGDVDSSNDLEAIEVMNAVGVMQGDERGFRPNDPINRNEVAKVMALLLNLTPEDYAYAVTPFVDVPEWAAPYVAACYANGITNGTSATTYSGANNVTAIQAARMMLRALGYLQNPEDDGDDWVLATATQASKIGLFDGVNQAGVHNALTRSQVATMALNALESTMVEDKSTKGMQVNTPDGTTVTQAYTPDYRRVSIEHEGDKNYTSAAGNYDPDDQGYGTMQLCEYLYGTDLKKTGSTTGEFGRPGSTWKYKGREIIGSSKSPLIVYSGRVSSSTVAKDLKGYVVGETVNGSAVGTTYKINDDVTGIPNIVVEDGASKTLNMSNKTPASRIANLAWGGGRVEVYATDDVIDCIVVVNPYIAKVTRVTDNEDGTYEVTLNIRERDANLTDNTIEVRDSSYARDDIVAITADVIEDDIKSIQKLDVITGKVTATKVDGKDTYIKLDGNQYYVSNKFFNYDANANRSNDGIPDVSAELTAYVKDGVVYGMDEVVDATKDYLYVIDATGGLGAAQAKVAFADGTQAKIDVVKLDDNKWGDPTFANDSDAQGMEGNVYTYTEDAGDYTLTPADYAGKSANINTPTTPGVGAIDSDTANVDLGSGAIGAQVITATNKTVFVDVDGKKTYVGYQNVPDVVTAKMSWGGKSATLAEVVFIVAGDITDKDSRIFYVRGNTPESTETVGGAKLRTYTVYEDGVKTSLTTKDMVTTGTSNLASETYILLADTVYYAKVVNSEGQLTKIKNEAPGLLGNAANVNSKVSFKIPTSNFGAVSTGNVKTAKKGVLELNASSGSCVYDKATPNGLATFTYDGDTVFMVVTANSDGDAGSSVAPGSAGDIVTIGSYADNGEYESTVYVLEVKDDKLTTPMATLVLVIQPKPVPTP